MDFTRIGRYLVVLALASGSRDALAQSSTDDDFSAMEDSGSFGGGERSSRRERRRGEGESVGRDLGDERGHDDEYRSGHDTRPGTRDPFEHSAYFEVGLFADRVDTGAGDAKLRYLPMRFGVEALAMKHWQIRARFGLAGEVVAPPSGDRQRAFAPGNLALGSYYAFGSAPRFDGPRWTVGVGGQLVAPTAQNPDGDAYGAYAGALGVHGLTDAWLFLPETASIVPGAYVRFGQGHLFANADLDVAFDIATDGGDRSHFMQLRLEAGFRGGESLRLGLGYTEVVVFGPNTSSDDHAQGALRLFVRADIKILTIGTELVMNLDDPYGFAFDGGIWGLVSRVGISL